MLRSSIRARLTAGVLLVQFVLAAGMVSTGIYFTRRRLRSSLDAALQARAMRVAALVRFSEEDNSKLIFDESLPLAPYDRRFDDYFEIQRGDGVVIARSRAWSDDIRLESPSGKEFWASSFGSIPYRAVRLKNVPILDREQDSPNPGTLTVFYAVPTLEMKQEVWQSGVFLGSVSVVLTLLTGLLAWWAIRRSLRPLNELATSASKIDINNWELGMRGGNKTPEELKPLVEAMETMLSNLERAFRQQRDFVADAAHELKTPVAILKSSLQSLQQKPRSTAEYQIGIEESLDDIGRLERLVQQLLRLARAEQWSSGAVERELDTIDVAETCERALLRVRGLAKSKAVSVHISDEGPFEMKADSDDLELVWVNLLENAIQYTPAGSTVTVALEHHDVGRCRVVVEDLGPGVPEDQLSRIFERFHRGDPSRARQTGGFGLGLAISKALVEAYGGTIRAENGLEGGTRMIVEFPVSPKALVSTR